MELTTAAVSQYVGPEMQLYVKTVVPALTVLIPAAYFTLVSVCGQKTLMDVAAETLLF